MFSLSKKSDYGLLLLSLLAKKKLEKRISIATVAQEYKLPYAFLSRIAAELANGGVLTGRVGAGGGYVLAKEPRDIRLADIMYILEGEWGPTRCTKHGKHCPYESICPVKDIWKNNLHSKIWSLFQECTLEDIIKA